MFYQQSHLYGCFPSAPPPPPLRPLLLVSFYTDNLQVISWASIAAGRAKPARPSPPAAVPAGLSRQTQSSPKDTAAGLEATPFTATRGEGNGEGVRNTPPTAAASENNGGAVKVSGGTSSGEGGDEAVCGGDGRDGAASSTTNRAAGVTASLTGVGGSEEAVAAGAAAAAAGGGKGDAAGVVVDEAARAKAKAEAESKEAEDAELAAEQRWRSLLGMLGREEVVAADAAGGAGAEAGAGGDLVHRGLVNTGNNCFRSVVLQALLACEPFVG